MLGLQDAEQTGFGWSGDELAGWAPAAEVDGVVGWLEAGVEGAREGTPTQLVCVTELLPSGDSGVALVDDEGADHGGDVADHGLLLS